MKKVNLKLAGITEILTKEQMKKIAGGYDGGYSVSVGCCSVGFIQCSGVGFQTVKVEELKLFLLVANRKTEITPICHVISY